MKSIKGGTGLSLDLLIRGFLFIALKRRSSLNPAHLKITARNLKLVLVRNRIDALYKNSIRNNVFLCRDLKRMNLLEKY